MGGKVEHPFKVEVWQGEKLVETLAVAETATIGIAAYEAAVKERPGRAVTLRHGARVVRSSEPPAPQAPPTVAMLRRLGVLGARLWCSGCGRHAVKSWEEIRATDDEPFPTCGRRLTCSACGGKTVQRMPDWPDPLAKR
jgi:hypothetical protein